VIPIVIIFLLLASLSVFIGALLAALIFGFVTVVVRTCFVAVFIGFFRDCSSDAGELVFEMTGDSRTSLAL